MRRRNGPGFTPRGSFQAKGAILLSGVSSALVAHLLSPEQLDSWGWRVPFVLGLAIGPVGYYMRLKLAEPAIFLDDHDRHSAFIASLAEIFATYKFRLAIGLGLVIAGSASLYVLFVFMSIYAIRVLHLDLSSAFIVPAVAGLMLAVFCPIMGHLSDGIGRKPALIA